MPHSDTSKPDIGILAIMADIEKLKPEKIENENFTGVDVYLDGREFINCTFKDCRLITNLGCYTIRGEKILLGGCTFHFLPPAQIILSTLNKLSDQPDPP
jgi:hypothetical protein